MIAVNRLAGVIGNYVDGVADRRVLSDAADRGVVTLDTDGSRVIDLDRTAISVPWDQLAWPHHLGPGDVEKNDELLVEAADNEWFVIGRFEDGEDLAPNHKSDLTTSTTDGSTSGIDASGIDAAVGDLRSDLTTLSNQVARDEQNIAIMADVRWPQTFTLYGPEPRTANALTIPPSQTNYALPGAAPAASAFRLLAGLDARLIIAYWDVQWTPAAAGCGIELVAMDPRLGNPTQLLEFTQDASAGVVSISVDITAQLLALLDTPARASPGSGTDVLIGHRLKGNGAVAPTVYLSRIHTLFSLR
jgi:hypothetical protein